MSVQIIRGNALALPLLDDGSSAARLAALTVGGYAVASAAGIAVRRSRRETGAASGGVRRARRLNAGHRSHTL